MKRSLSLLFLPITLLIFPAGAHAQAWVGIINSPRAADWTQAGIPGGLPDSAWTQCGSTIAAYTGTAATINNSLAACGANKYVLLGAGTFTLSTGIQFPQNTIGHLVLRGQGANSTFLNFSGGGSLINVLSSDGTFPGGANTVHNWTAGYAQGATQITLDSVSGIVAGKTLLVLNQCDTGFSGSDCATGSSVDNGGYFACSSQWLSAGVGCTLGDSIGGPDGSTWRNSGSGPTAAGSWQMETVQVTAINQGGCGATCVTINQPLKHPNWASGQSPQAVLIQPIPQVGIENLAIDGSAGGASAVAGIGFQNAYQCWVSGVKISNTYARGITGIDVFHMLIKDNYIYHGSSSYSDGMAIRFNWGGDNLVQNNIVEQWKAAYVNDGPSSGDVIAYNFFVNQLSQSGTDWMWSAVYAHSAGDDFQLREGNAFNAIQDDNIHGTHLNNTMFRNFIWGFESCANGNCGASLAKDSNANALNEQAGTRYAAIIANVLGTSGFTTLYQDATNSPNFAAYTNGTGFGSPPYGNPSGARPPDPLTVSTSLRWGNHDVVTGAVRWCGNSSDTGWSTTCASTSEVPTGAPVYPNSIPTKGDTGAGQAALPASFYLSFKPSWFGSIPFPPIGPDVSGGNVGQCAGVLNTAGHQSGLPATTNGQCVGTSLTTPAWGGHVNTNPAMNCYLNVMRGLPDGTGAVLAFDAKTCYGSGLSSSPPPNPPTNLVDVVN
jgi:hypothetical protein